jgi:hypothetical protein
MCGLSTGVTFPLYIRPLGFIGCILSQHESSAASCTELSRLYSQTYKAGKASTNAGRERSTDAPGSAFVVSRWATSDDSDTVFISSSLLCKPLFPGLQRLRLMLPSAVRPIARTSSSFLRASTAIRLRPRQYTVSQHTGRSSFIARMSSSTSPPSGSVAAPDATTKPTALNFELSDVAKHGKPLGEGNYIRCVSLLFVLLL